MGGPSTLPPGRPLEASGNARPRWMATARVLGLGYRIPLTGRLQFVRPPPVTGGGLSIHSPRYRSGRRRPRGFNALKAVKTIAALIFLSVIAVVLVQPVLGADDDERRTKRNVAASAEPTVAAGAEAEEGVELTARYPKRCMRRTREAPTGLVAARRGSTADIGFPGQRPAARIQVSGDVAWSPSGRFLAESGGLVYDQTGNPQGALFFEPRQWQWSPVADCALATTERGSLTFSIPDTNRKGIRLLNAPVLDFELSPNGRRLAAVVEDRGLWIADLRRGRLAQATEGPASITGWFSNRSVLYSKSRGQGKLRFATGRGKTGIVGGALAGGALEECGGRTLLVPVTTEGGPAIAELAPRRGGIDVPARSPGIRGYSSAACSPDGSALAAVASDDARGRGPLVMLDPDGELVRALSDGRTANPVWSAEGLMFVKFGKADRGRLWLIAPGTDPAPTAYRVGAPTQFDWHVR